MLIERPSKTAPARRHLARPTSRWQVEESKRCHTPGQFKDPSTTRWTRSCIQPDGLRRS